MKKLFAILCSIFLMVSLVSVSYADDTPVNIIPDEVEVSQKEEISTDSNINYNKNILKKLTEKSEIRIRCASRKYSDIGVTYKFNTANLEEQQEKTGEFIDKLIALIESEEKEICSVHDSFSDTSKINRWTDGAEHSFSLDIYLDEEGKERRLGLLLHNNHLFFFIWDEEKYSNYNYVLNDIDAISEYLFYAYENELSALEESRTTKAKTIIRCEFDWENQVLTEDIINSKFKYMEKIEFEVTTDESYYDTVFEEVGELGETIHCTVDHIVGSGSIYIMTMEGSRGTKQLATRVTSWGFSGATGNKLYFDTNCVIEDDKMIYYENSMVGYHRISFGGVVSGNGVDGVKLEYYFTAHYPKFIAPPTPLVGTNIRHEFYGTEKDLERGNNIYTLFGIGEKDVYIKEQIEKEKEFDSQPQDPERYVTKKKGTFGDDVESYYLTFIGEIPLELFGSNRPDWYSALGKNVKAMLVGFTDTINGKDRDNYTMLRFSGSEKDVWFKLSFIEASEELAAGDYTSDKELSLNMEYNSLISFDGVTMIRNTVEYDTVGAKMTFSNDGELSFEGITFSIGNRTVNVKAEDINYIGGGKATYEKLW